MDKDDLDFVKAIKAAMNKVIDDRAGVINNVFVLQSSTGAKVELQSSTEPLGALIGSAHASLDKLKESNGVKGSPPYVG